MPPAKKTSSAQNTTLQSMGMDVIKQYPGPLTVSRAVKLATSQLSIVMKVTGRG